ncbi:hypothetical protein BCR42DRAFT_82141 [Absidia repens]|uniref:Uncharacterized protein n=1 Tax=Absidia repens TaxID=90262 RepID=A0A1X2I9Y4_9FUNG|nr:hypothetical protein BCR42DRAFT_82141 [Absidia repens]
MTPLLQFLLYPLTFETKRAFADNRKYGLFFVRTRNAAASEKKKAVARCIKSIRCFQPSSYYILLQKYHAKEKAMTAIQTISLGQAKNVIKPFGTPPACFTFFVGGVPL